MQYYNTRKKTELFDTKKPRKTDIRHKKHHRKSGTDKRSNVQLEKNISDTYGF